MANSRSGDSVISRVVRLMSAFDRDLPTMTLSGLARRARLPLTTAHRLVGDLVLHGLIERRDPGCFGGCCFRNGYSSLAGR
ncbi:helix-turn-helix domain-containing protein [Arthrobacter sp.]|uniref:helix-turn-helix domain-containing protein n=1 Tax=Arthrobacter sp. TaxID=1667 RepID=UPI003392E0E3